jgi:hypothetical protein
MDVGTSWREAGVGSLSVLYALQFLAILTAGYMAWGASEPLLAGRRGRRGGGGRRGGVRSARGQASGVFVMAARAIIVLVATLAAAVAGSRDGAIWLAAIGASFLLVDSLTGQVARDPARALVPLGVGCLQLVLLLIVVQAG